tara:strand:- start:918 stop:1274 length:357 start_codon:yes stop_codon:yes gene_type:complete
MGKSCIINPYIYSFSDNDNLRRYKSMLAKLIYEGFDVLCHKDRKKGFIVSECENVSFKEKISRLSNEFNVNVIFVDSIEKYNITDFIKAPQPTNGMGRWALVKVAQSRWQDLDLGEDI